MCVALPGRVVLIGESTPISIPAIVSISAAERDVDLVMVPHAEVGDYVIVHSGYAIEIIPRERALETLSLLGSVEDHLSVRGGFVDLVAGVGRWPSS